MSAAASAPKPEAESPKPLPKPLKPEALDALAAEYLAIKKEIDDAEVELAEKFKVKVEGMDALRLQFTEVCEAYGSPHEKKSKLFFGLDYEVMTTASASSSQDQRAITVFEAKCAKAGKSDLFSSLFEKVSEYRPRPGAGEVVRRSMGNKLTARLALWYLKCTVTKANPPRLADVRLRKKS